MASVNYRALPAAVPAIRAALSDFLDGLGVSPSQSADIQLAVTEASSNVVRHAYPHTYGDISCDAHAADGTLTVNVYDWGFPFTSQSPDPGLGVGTPLMNTLADHVTRTHHNGTKQVELTFAIHD